jgi:uncharacterized membrane protein YeaQ/YmgE (transglycosylase-associated protein family)
LFAASNDSIKETWTMGAIITWAVFGLCVGAIARLLYPGRQSMGLIATMLLGVVGSLLGGLIVYFVQGAPGGPFDGAGWIMSIVGALVVVWITLYAGRRRVA